MELAVEVKLHEIPKYVSNPRGKDFRKWFRYANSWQNNTFMEFVTLGSNLLHFLLRKYFSRMLTDINEWTHVACEIILTFFGLTFTPSCIDFLYKHGVCIFQRVQTICMKLSRVGSRQGLHLQTCTRLEIYQFCP